MLEMCFCSVPVLFDTWKNLDMKATMDNFQDVVFCEWVKYDGLLMWAFLKFIVVDL